MLMLWAARPAKQTETADNVSGCVGVWGVQKYCIPAGANILKLTPNLRVN